MVADLIAASANLEATTAAGSELCFIILSKENDELQVVFMM